MSAQNMLERLMKSGMDLLDGKSGAPGAAQGITPDWRQLGAGAVAGGALGLLLGSKRGRKMGGKALKYGSVAALGYAGYQIYKNWQAKQQRSEPGQSPGARADIDSATEPRWQTGAQGTPLLPAPEMESHSRAMLQAMIAAAKADGHLDERERGLISAELARLEADPAQRQWLEQEIRRPLDPAEVARAAVSPAMASEMYLASLLVADETSFMERAYLDELARQMKLPDSLKRQLEEQALAA